jgi:hypothetical protein
MVRPQVRELLSSSPGFRALPADRRRQVANDTVRVASYMTDPNGLLSQEFRKPLLAGVVHAGVGKKRIDLRKVAPDTIRLGPGSMDALVAALDFPSFVADLIQGVFGAIVNASRRQMEAYAGLIANVAKSVDEFADDNITDQSARDELVSEFPDAVCLTGTAAQRLKLHAGAGSPALAALAAAIGLREPVAKPQLASEVARVVAASRRRLARNRQQLLATMVLMGINRIVITSGSIAPGLSRR